MIRLNNSDNYEHLCNVVLTREKFPIAFANKVEELIKCNPDKTRDEVEKMVSNMEIELELYYHTEYGLFAVESEAVECGTIYSPYSGELLEDALEE